MLLKHSLLILQMFLSLSYSIPLSRTSTTDPQVVSSLSRDISTRHSSQNQETQPENNEDSLTSNSRTEDKSRDQLSESSQDQLVETRLDQLLLRVSETNLDQHSTRRSRRSTRRVTGKQRSSVDRANRMSMGGFFYHPGSKGKKKGGKRG